MLMHLRLNDVAYDVAFRQPCLFTLSIFSIHKKSSQVSKV
jgi:hypothetical protein